MSSTKKQRLAPKHVYHARVRRNIFVAFVLIAISLMIGITGYKLTVPEFDWYDSLLNASMILSGMGPIIDPSITLSNTAKVFASLYALFSGITFIASIGILIAPLAHRFFHRMHLEDSDNDE